VIIAGFDVSFPGILYTIVGLIILWIIVSIPVWLAGKAITGGKASFGDALLATLAGPIVYFVVVFLVGFFLGSSALVFGYILALIAWIGVFKLSFQTGWLRAISHSNSCVGYLCRIKHNNWCFIRISISSAIFPKNIVKVIM